MNRLLSLVVCVLAVTLYSARAEGPDDQYVRIYNLMQQADALNDSGQPAAALAKYLDALVSLQRFQKVYPDWNVKVVNFRLNHLASKVSAMSAQAPAPAAPAGPPAETKVPAAAARPATTPEKPGPSAELDRQISLLQDEVHRLQSDKASLELKLKEAFATRPATVDPRELAKAQEKVQSLLKENELLKVSQAQPPTKPAPATESKALAEMQAALTEANQKLSAQTEIANALALEKKVLQNRLAALTPGTDNPGQLNLVKQARDDAERKLANQTDLTAKLTAEKDALQVRLKTLAAAAETADALRAENQMLKQQLADAKSSGAKSEDLSRKLALAEARVAALQSDAEILRLEKTALENRAKTSAAQIAPSAVVVPGGRAEDLRRIKLLEEERYDLAKKLDAANKELGSRKGKAGGTKVAELSKQVASLHARLEILEARAVPYTSEELALFKQPEPTLVVPDSKARKRSVKTLPRGTAPLVAEAQREFAAGRFDKAEEKYLEVLRQDEKNAYTLANLAAIQMELNRLDEADKHIRQALAADPNDAYSLSILGQLRFRQGKYDEAFDALSRAARLNPQSAEIQNFLGVTLSHKGLRIPAENALRKAIQLDPAYGSAHNNLAVIYATQQPPQLELARWHYQRALAAGQARNADLEKFFEQKASAGGAK